MKMTELEKYEAVNKTTSLMELADVIRSFGGTNGLISGRTRNFDADNMAKNCIHFNFFNINYLTREFGIRQQAMMHYYYGDK